MTAPAAELRADQQFAQAGRRVVEARAREMLGHADGVLDVGEPDRVHDMRVASRRLQAGLEIFATCFALDEHAAALSELKRLSNALGERRDRDVQLAFLEQLRGEVSGSERAAIKVIVKQLRRERRRANRRLARALKRADEGDLAGRLTRLSA